MANQLISDRNVAFLLYEVLDAEALTRLPFFRDHSRESFDLVLATARKIAREVLWPAFKPMDEDPPRLDAGQVHVHPLVREILPRLFEVGFQSATRPTEIGGQQLPSLVANIASSYAMAANGAAYGYVGLTSGAAHLIEVFGSERLKAMFMSKLYSGTWTGTMALTEPHAGSSLADVRARARPSSDGAYAIEGNKVFISGGDQDASENIVHLTLARIDGAPPGIGGVSLFAIPKKRPDDEGRLIDNDCRCAGVFHKMGWRGLPSIALNFGESGNTRGWLVGEANRGISHMFQMMNEARIMVGFNGIATASAAYFESLEYAKTRPQGRPLGAKDPTTPQIPIIAHTDVRRMLLRQKAIVEGGYALLATTSHLQDLAHHAETEEQRRDAAILLDLLTPIAKTFPAEKGFESNALAVQIHGGYGYTSEYLPEAWLRDQKLNSIHEGTSGIQSLDLLGRKAVAESGRALVLFGKEISKTQERANAAGIDASWTTALSEAAATIGEVTMHLGMLGLSGDREAMLLHAFDYLDMFATTAVAWQWVLQAAVAKEGLARSGDGSASADFYRGKLAAAEYWLKTELPRVRHLRELCMRGEDSYARAQPEWL